MTDKRIEDFKRAIWQGAPASGEFGDPPLTETEKNDAIQEMKDAGQLR